MFKYKKKKVIAVLAIMVFAPLYLLAQSEIITINNTKIFKKKSRPPVAFTHSQHMTLEGVSCSDCHHLFVNGKNVLDSSKLVEGNPAISCSGCHNTEPDIKRVYHHLCIKCHEKAIDSGKAGGPRKCGECHKLNKQE
jgi:hypothetical protein